MPSVTVRAAAIGDGTLHRTLNPLPNGVSLRRAVSCVMRGPALRRAGRGGCADHPPRRGTGVSGHGERCAGAEGAAAAPGRASTAREHVDGAGKGRAGAQTPASPEARRRRYRSWGGGSRPGRAAEAQMAGRAPDIRMARRSALGA